MNKRFASLRWLLGSLLLISVWASADAKPAPATAEVEQAPKVLVESVTQELFGLVKAQKANNTSDEVYFSQVKARLDEVVSFGFIAANVMGQQAFAKATPKQRQQFLDVFRDGLVRSYAKGIAGYADSEVKIVGVVADKKNPKRVNVHQEVVDKGTTYKLDYTMLQGKTGDWKLINVTLNGVNLGVSFASQFKSAMRKHNNDLDKVIAGWLEEV